MTWSLFIIAGAVLAYAVWCVVEALRGGEERAVRHAEPRSAPSPMEELQALSPAAVELLLDLHYRQVLSSAEGRKTWRNLLADVNAARRLNRV
jgi:hypothetical protein